MHKIEAKQKGFDPIIFHKTQCPMNSRYHKIKQLFVVRSEAFLFLTGVPNKYVLPKKNIIPVIPLLPSFDNLRL